MYSNNLPRNNDLDLQEYLISHPAATFFMRAVGNSLAAMGILNHDLLIVDRSLVPKPRSLVVAVVNGELMIQRYTLNFKHEIWGVITYAIHDVRAG